MLSRRRFLSIAGGSVAGGVAGWAGLLRDAASAVAATPSAPVLVLIENQGGNDGLNTLVPADGRYRDARPRLALPEASLVALSGRSDFSLHPALAPLAPLWGAGQLAFIEGIGFEDSSRSHFEALDWWWSAQPGQTRVTGWLGRWLDLRLATTGDDNPLRAVCLGGGSPALTGATATATVVRSPESFTFFAPRGADRDDLVNAFLATGEPRSDVPYVALAQRAMVDTVAAVATFAQLAGRPAEGSLDVAPEARGRRDATGVTSALEVAANLIEANVGTEVIVVDAGGYDTHANQLATHEVLLDDLANGIASFFSTLDERGLADRVLVATTSEFGRRVAENASEGTDHGRGSVQLLVGPGVRGTITGELDLAHLQDGDVSPTVDARSLYTACLDWLGAPAEEVLDRRYDDLGLLRT